MGQTGVPQAPYHLKPLVDDLVINRDVADLLSTIEELRHQQVFALRCDLDDSVRLGYGEPRGVHEPEEVVLVLHQPANGVERLLVLQPAVHQGPTELVPTVGSDVRRGVQLAEDVRVRVALELHAKRRRAARSFEPEGFHLDRDHTELILESLHDGVVASTGHIKVRGTPSLVRNREHLVGGEQPEGAEWNRDADDNSEQRVGQRFLCEVQARQQRQEQESRNYDLADLSPPSGRYEG